MSSTTKNSKKDLDSETKINPNEIIYNVDFTQVILFSVCGLVLLILAMVCLIYGNGFLMFFGLILTVVVLYIVMIIFRNIAFDKEILVLDEFGFMDNSTEDSIGFVPWEAVEDIASLDIGKKHKKPMISVKIHEEYLEELGIDREAVLSQENSKVFGEINISLQLIKESDVEVLKTMENYVEKYKIKN